MIVYSEAKLDDSMFTDICVKNRDFSVPDNGIIEGRKFRVFEYNGDKWIFKCSERELARDIHSELTREIFCRELVRALGLSGYTTDYMIVEYKGKPYLASKSFLSDFEHEAYVALDEFPKISGCRTMYEFFMKTFISLDTQNALFESFKDGMSKLTVLVLIDSLVGQNDRFNRNVGFIKTVRGYKVAPMFDSECCMYFSDIKEESHGDRSFGDCKNWESIVRQEGYRGHEDWKECLHIVSKNLLYKEVVKKDIPCVAKQVYANMISIFPDSQELIDAMCRVLVGR